MMQISDFHTHFYNSDARIIYNSDANDISLSEIFSYGFHPDNLSPDFRNFFSIINNKRCAAVGECGLDVTLPCIEKQKEIFDFQVKEALKAGKPLIIHCVRAYNEVIRILKKNKFNLPVVFHAYNGNLQTTRQLLSFNNTGFSFSNRIFKNIHNIKPSIDIIDVHKIFIETDNNISDNKELTLNKLAQIKGLSPENLACVINQNFDTFVALSLKNN